MDIGAPPSPDSALSCRTLPTPTFRYEISPGRKSGAVICGVDEAGLGSLAGPVVACKAIHALGEAGVGETGRLDIPRAAFAPAIHRGQ